MFIHLLFYFFIFFKFIIIEFILSLAATKEQTTILYSPRLSVNSPVGITKSFVPAQNEQIPACKQEDI